MKEITNTEVEGRHQNDGWYLCEMLTFLAYLEIW